MTYEVSSGAVVFTREGGGIRYVIVRSLEGYYGFPKGHIEGAETEEEAAHREIKEETGLSVRLVPGFRTIDEHTIPEKPGVTKRIIYSGGIRRAGDPITKRGTAGGSASQL